MSLTARRVLAAPWLKDALWRKAQAVPSLDLRFADNKSLGDSVSGQNLITFSRASSGTFVDSAGVLQTAATNAPRFDHNPLTVESLGLLVEEPRTNSIRNNTMSGAVAGTPGTLPTNWNVSGLGALTQQIVGVGVVDGVSYIDIRFSGTTSTTQVGIRFESAGGAPGTNGQTFTYSVWLARVAGSSTNVTAITCNANLYDAATAYVSSPGFTGFDSFTNPTSLIRRAGTLTIASATSAYIQPQIAISFASGVAIDITLRIGLPQLEQGAFATSVIPTTTAAATRSADVVEITGSNFSRWHRQDEQTWFAEYAPVYTASATVPANTPHVIQVYTSSSVSNNYAIRGASNSTSQEFVARNPTAGAQFFNNPSIGFGSAGVNRKVSYGINSSALNYSTNGTIGTATNNAAALMATHDILSIGSGTGGSPPYQLNGTIKRLTYFPARLPNTTLQRLTQ